MLKNTILSLIRVLMSPTDGQGGGIGGSDVNDYPPAEGEDVHGDDVSDDESEDDGDDTDGDDSGDGEGSDDGEGDQGQTDGDGKPKPEEKPKKPEQSPEFNAKQKALRLQREAAERERREAEIKKAREEGMIEALGGVNPYTGKKIADEADLETYRIMKAIKDRGGDPIADFHEESARIRREQAAQAAKKAQEAEQARKSMQDEVSNFKASYPKVDLQALLNDDGFKSFATRNNRIERIGLVDTYELYLEHKDAEASREKNRGEREQNRRDHSPGSVNGGGNVPNDIYSEEELASLTEEEAAANLEKAIRSQQYHARHKKRR